ncbi:MAG: tetratricopeptide repeat protein, partial [Mariniphaga sp.]|nr:tetratricopeptide repeat protein [Mariniphaga sp.]
MKVSHTNLALIVFSSIYLLFPNLLLSQEIIGNESLAIEYFNEKNYEKALPIFTQLINKSPGNAMYNYYYGVSLLKNNRYDTATKEALLNAVVDKTPSNANFYLANYFHALGNWSEAIDFYKRYDGSNREHRELEYDKYLDMCMKRINPFTIDKGDPKNIFVDTIKVLGSRPNEKNFPIPDSLRIEWFNFQINSQLTYHGISDFRSEAAKILFTKAWIATGINDSIVKNTDILRKAHEETHNVTTRIALVQRIIDAEQQSYQLLRDRETYFEQARTKEAGYWEKAGADAMAIFITEIA